MHRPMVQRIRARYVRSVALRPRWRWAMIGVSIYLVLLGVLIATVAASRADRESAAATDRATAVIEGILDPGYRDPRLPYVQVRWTDGDGRAWVRRLEVDRPDTYEIGQEVRVRFDADDRSVPARFADTPVDEPGDDTEAAAAACVLVAVCWAAWNVFFLWRHRRAARAGRGDAGQSLSRG